MIMVAIEVRRFHRPSDGRPATITISPGRDGQTLVIFDSGSDNDGVRIPRSFTSADTALAVFQAHCDALLGRGFVTLDERLAA